MLLDSVLFAALKVHVGGVACVHWVSCLELFLLQLLLRGANHLLNDLESAVLQGELLDVVNWRGELQGVQLQVNRQKAILWLLLD